MRCLQDSDEISFGAGVLVMVPGHRRPCGIFASFENANLLRQSAGVPTDSLQCRRSNSASFTPISVSFLFSAGKNIVAVHQSRLSAAFASVDRIQLNLNWASGRSTYTVCLLTNHRKLTVFRGPQRNKHDCHRADTSSACWTIQSCMPVRWVIDTHVSRWNRTI